MVTPVGLSSGKTQILEVSVWEGISVSATVGLLRVHLLESRGED